MDITNVTEHFAWCDPHTGNFVSEEEYSINLAAKRHEGLLVSYTTQVGYAVHVLNDGTYVVHAARSGRTRYFSAEELVRIALAEGLDSAPTPKGGA